MCHKDMGEEHLLQLLRLQKDSQQRKHILQAAVKALK